MKNFILYESSTGEIKRSGSCQEEDFQNQQQDGFILIEGKGNAADNYIKNGVIETYTEQQQKDKAQRLPYFYVWSNETFTWQDTRTQQQQTEAQKLKVDTQRDTLLSESDWLVVRQVDNGVPMPQAWKDYREALRQIDKQPGYPFNVVWPNPPSVA